MAKPLAVELVRDRIRVNVVSRARSSSATEAA
jgi:hypothetical protein